MGTVRRGSCPICGDPGSEALLEREGARYVKCLKCSLVYSDPATDENGLREIADEWARCHHASPDRVEWEKEQALADIVFGRRMKIIDRYRSVGRLLDVGCSTGFFLEYAMKRGWKVAGCEIAHHTAAQARERLGSDIREGSFTEVKFQADFFDAVTMFDVLEHVLDPAAFVREAFRVLRPGGILVVVTPNYDSLSRRVLGGRWEALVPSRHLQVFNPRTAGEIISRCGGRVCDLRTIDINPLDLWNALTGGDSYNFEKRRESISRTKKIFTKIPALNHVRNLMNVLLNFSRIGDVIELYVERDR